MMSTTGRILISFFVVWFSVAAPIGAFAQTATDALGNPTGAPECTGASCHQGEDQGLNQGASQGLDQGGAVVDENGDADGVVQGADQGTTNGITATNSNTGSDSTNTDTVNANASTTTAVTNAATDTTTGAATGTTGGNAANQNTGTGGVTTGNAGIGVTQVKNDNTAVVGGTAGLTTSGHNGDYLGDLLLGFGAGTANLSGANGGSVRATNDTTGSNSTNGIDVTTTTEQITEVQNDGRIDNLLDLAAITGQNEANKNTGDGRITTGDADVAATLINLLNTTVVNGDLWVTVADIFGNLEGDIIVPDLAALAASFRPQQTTIDANNNLTGSNSNNAIDVALRDTETTDIINDADITTQINADAITGQNTAEANTGGSDISTGDASVTGSNISIANTTVEGGNWGLFIVNALNGWLGFLVGDNGSVRALTQEETIREIEANNATTGSDSTNTIAVTDERNRTTNVDNKAVINNQINAQAITGQNEASENTGQGAINTGNATVQATAVNIANTTVKDGSLFIAVVNVLGDWLGDLFYNGTSLAQTAASNPPAGGAAHQVDINAGNSNTGSESTNAVNVDIDRTHTTTIVNDADLDFALNANVDTGNNRANRNTEGAIIKTGEGFLAQHSRTVANVTAIAGQGGLSVNMTGENDTTGFDSTNTIRADINDSRVVAVNNDANVSTLLGGPRQGSALVNTGHNEANQNTLGALIATGNAIAEISIQNLVNRVIFALGGEGVNVDANFTNTLTGALSENLNHLNVIRDVLATIVNNAIVDNIINLILNTGNNTANENTDGASISTGSVCVDVSIDNVINSKKLLGVTGSTITNNAVVQNIGNILGTTGNNDMLRNTVGGAADNPGDCDKVAVVPPPAGGPAPGVGGGPTEEDGEGGGEVEEAEEQGAVAGISEEQPKQPRIAADILKRFPVAGGESLAQWLPGARQPLWLYFLVGSALFVGAAWHFDRRSRHLLAPAA